MNLVKDNKSKIINERIKDKQVFLILENGDAKGIVSRREALDYSSKVGLDLVLISSQKDKPPICKVMDYGKMIYSQNKSKSKKKLATKEIHLRNAMGIDVHDLKTKHKQIRKFLDKKHRVKYIFTVRGRQRRDMKEALKRCNEYVAGFDDIAIWKDPKISGGSIIVLLCPKSV